MAGDEALRIAVPSKGRLHDRSLDLLRRAGLRFRFSGRRLFADCSDTGTRIIFSNAADIPVLVAEGVVDLGMTGSDQVAEKSAKVTELRALGFGHCRLSIAVHKDSSYRRAADLAGKVVGCKGSPPPARLSSSIASSSAERLPPSMATAGAIKRPEAPIFSPQ